MAAPKGILDNEELIDSVVDMMSRGWRTGKIKKAVRELAHKQGLIESAEVDALGASTITELIGRARTRMKVLVKQVDDDSKAEILNILRGVLNRQAGKDDRIVVTAANSMMKLLGLEPQFKDQSGDNDVEALRESLGIEPNGAEPPPAPEGDDATDLPDVPDIDLPDVEDAE